MIFTNANDTKKNEGSMLSYYNYTSSKKFSTYEPCISKLDDKRYFLNSVNNNFKDYENMNINYSSNNYDYYKSDYKPYNASLSNNKKVS